MPQDVVDLWVEFAARMVALAREMPIDEARTLCRERLADGSAWMRFAEMVRLHGGDLEAFEGRRRAEGGDVLSAGGGFVASIDAQKVAQAAFELGAGRAQSTDSIDPEAGVRLLVTRGDKVSAGQSVAKLHAPMRPERLEVASRLVQDAVVISEDAPAPKALVLEVVE